MLYFALMAVVIMVIVLFRPITLEVNNQIDKLEVNAHGIYEITDKEDILQAVHAIHETTFRKRIFSQREAPNDLTTVVLLMREETVAASVVICDSQVYVLDDSGAYIAYNGERIALCIDKLIDLDG